MELDAIFLELSKHLDEYPEKKERWLQEAKEKVLTWIQQKNHGIFEDLLTQMKPMEFENLS